LSSLTRATAVMTVGTLLSRVTGLLRVVAVAAALGVVETKLADTYNLGNTAPNIIYELVLGGVLTSVFVPVFVELLDKEGRERAWEVASAIINLSVVILTAVTIVGILVAPWIADFYASRLHGGAEVEQQRILTFLLRLFIPQIIFYGLYSVTTGLLNAHRRFAAPMYTPVLNNLAVIAVFVAFALAYGTVGLEKVSNWQLFLIGGGTTGGIALMALAQLPFLRGLGKYKLTFSVRHPSVKKLARLAVFVIGYVVVNQIGYLVVQRLANGQQGGYTAYVSAFAFFLLPHGLFAVSVITALLPGMSEHASAGRWDEYRERLSTGVRATVLLILPAAVGYFLLAHPIVRLLLQHGVATSRSTDLVADVLRIFVVGLVPFSLFQLFLRAFYALQDTKTPFVINVLAVGANTIFNVLVFDSLRVEGLAAGLAGAYAIGAVVQWRALSRRIGGVDGARVARSSVRIAAAAAGMAGVVWATSRLMERGLEPSGLLEATLAVAVPVAVGAIAYLGLATLFHVEELAFVRNAVVGRLARRPDRSET
jgi:putative peptidoglycan lipid II flippase